MLSILNRSLKYLLTSSILQLYTNYAIYQNV